MEVLAAIDRLEARFDVPYSVVWAESNWHISLYFSAAYLALIFLGRWLMRNHPAYQLRQPLILWNLSLAVFSMICFLKLAPSLVVRIYNEGVVSFMCEPRANQVPHVVLWGVVFISSKVVELGDTAFIVLRKKPLIFLHYYHHVTVMVYCWFSLSRGPSTPGQTFGAVNCLVHCFMYTYYALAAAGWRIPSRIPLCITLLQISQMFVGIYVNAVSYYGIRHHEDYNLPHCAVNKQIIYSGFVMYASYVVLFLNFFLQRYVFKRKPARLAAASDKVLEHGTNGSVCNGIHSTGLLQNGHLKND